MGDWRLHIQKMYGSFGSKRARLGKLEPTLGMHCDSFRLFVERLGNKNRVHNLIELPFADNRDAFLFELWTTRFAGESRLHAHPSF